MNDNQTKTSQQIFDGTGFGLLVKDLRKKNPQMSQAEAVRRVSQSHPEAHELCIKIMRDGV